MAERYKIDTWKSVEAEGDWPLLLVGNGASCAVSDTFAYKKLLDVANLSRDEREIFTAVGTVNFEAVLDYLRVAAVVCDQLRHKADDVLDRYDSIRTALIEAINDHHVAWRSIPIGPLENYRAALLGHRITWSTSYDLLSYWAVMAPVPAGGKRIGDCFWNEDGAFDLANAAPSSPIPMIYWIHGALHLYRVRSGETVKLTHQPGRTLLDLLGTTFRGAALPLFVSEGTALQKMRAIRSSDYLSHAYKTLSESEDDLVVFGQAFGRSDSHLVKAINRNPHRRIAFSVYAKSSQEANSICARTEKRFPRATVRFFNANTHPLGA